MVKILLLLIVTFSFVACDNNKYSSAGQNQDQTSLNKSVFQLTSNFYAFFPQKPIKNESDFLRQKKIQHFSFFDDNSKIQYDAMVFDLRDYNIENVDDFLISFINGENMSVEGEILHQKRTNTDNKEGYLYFITYLSDAVYMLKYVQLVFHNNMVYKWSVTGIDGVSDSKASQIFYEKKNFMKIK